MANIQSSPSSFSDNTNPAGVSQMSGATAASAYIPPADPSAARLSMSGLASGATQALQDIAGRVFNFDFRNANGTPINPDNDWRVRISMQAMTASLFYNNQLNGIMYPLSQTKGLVFPYTPQLTLTHNARYGETAVTHSNYKSYFYEGSDIQSINLSCDFTVQNIQEGQYYMAAVHFLRACTKMFFGASNLAGTPPPLVFLDGYGSTVLPHVPCVITSFQQTMPSDVDYIAVPVGTPLQNIVGNQIRTDLFGDVVRLPTMSTLQVTLQPVYSRASMANNFTLEKFNAGLLYARSTNSVGGFL